MVNRCGGVVLSSKSRCHVASRNQYSFESNFFKPENNKKSKKTFLSSKKQDNPVHLNVVSMPEADSGRREDRMHPGFLSGKKTDLLENMWMMLYCIRQYILP